MKKVVKFRHAIWPAGTTLKLEAYMYAENPRDDYLVCDVPGENLTVELLSRDILNTFNDAITKDRVAYRYNERRAYELPSEITVVGKSKPILGTNGKPLFPYEAYTGFYEYGSKSMTKREYYLMVTGPQVTGHTLPARQEYNVNIKF